MSENYNDRVNLKGQNNEYHKKEELGDFNGVHPVVAERSERHNKMLESKDQTWYFVLADCKGTLEIMKDEVSRKYQLLGLSRLWQEINEKDYEGYETDDSNLSEAERIQRKTERLQRFTTNNNNADSFEETNLILEHENRERRARAQRDMMKPSKSASYVDKADEERELFNFDEYAEKNHLTNIKEFGEYASSHHLKIKSAPIKVQL